MQGVVAYGEGGGRECRGCTRKSYSKLGNKLGTLSLFPEYIFNSWFQVSELIWPLFAENMTRGNGWIGLRGVRAGEKGVKGFERDIKKLLPEPEANRGGGGKWGH